MGVSFYNIDIIKEVHYSFNGYYVSYSTFTSGWYTDNEIKFIRRLHPDTVKAFAIRQECLNRNGPNSSHLHWREGLRSQSIFKEYAFKLSEDIKKIILKHTYKCHQDHVMYYLYR